MSEEKNFAPLIDMRPESGTSNVKSDAAVNMMRTVMSDNPGICSAVVLEDVSLDAVPDELRESYGGSAFTQHGVVVRASGKMPVTTETACLLNHNMGMASSLYPVEALALDGSTLSIAEFERRWKNAHSDGRTIGFDSAEGRSHNVVVRAIDSTLSDAKFYIVVRANDSASALHLMEYAARNNLTLVQVAKSPLYADLLESSQHRRDQIARSSAQALGVSVAAAPELTTLSHSIVQATASAHQSTSTPGLRDGTEQYAVYNGATDTSAAHNGALIWQGVMGGYARVSNTREKTLGNGFASRAWKTDTMSALSTDAPHFEPTDHGAPATHRSATSDLVEAFPRKVHWDGSADLHPLADEKRALITDAMVAETAAPSDSSNRLHVTQMHFVVGTLPAHKRAISETFEQLAAEARAHPDKSALPVPFDSDAMRTLTRHFDRVPTTQTVAQVMRMGTKVPLSPLVTQRSLCTAHENDANHYHSWYDDSVEVQAEHGRVHERMASSAHVGAPMRSIVMLNTDLIRSVEASIERAKSGVSADASVDETSA